MVRPFFMRCKASIFFVALALAGGFRHAQAVEGHFPASEAATGLRPLGTLITELTLSSELTLRALAMIGTPYRYGGSLPETGLDCSGLVRYVFREAAGTELPRTSEEMSRLGNEIALPDLQPGDLVFYNTLQRTFSHVGIYLGASKFIHAPARGGQVRIDSMEADYWKHRFNGARRIGYSG